MSKRKNNFRHLEKLLVKKVDFDKKSVNNFAFLCFTLGPFVTWLAFYSICDWKGILLNIPFWIFSLYFVLFFKETDYIFGLLFCFVEGLFMVFAFSLMATVMYNMAFNSRELRDFKLVPSIWIVLIVIMISLLFRKKFFEWKINKREDKTNNNKVVLYVSIASSLGVLVSKLFLYSNAFLEFAFLLNCAVISMFVLCTYTDFYLLLKVKDYYRSISKD